MTTVQKNLKEQIVDILKTDIDEAKKSDTLYKRVCTLENIDAFASYCLRQLLEKDKKTGKDKNPFMKTKTAIALSNLFRRVGAEGLVFDGKHISLQNIGISYDYVAYKNKMLTAYPESKIDMSVVNEGDETKFSKDNGKIVYTHNVGDPFDDKKDIIGAYCIIKNSRGEFLTTLNKEDIAKHRKVAKTDYIWSAWFKEMVLKTVLKKACKYHFDDIFEGMNEIDNETIDLSKVETVREPVDAKEVEAVIKKIESIKVLATLKDYYIGLDKKFIKNDDVFEAYTAQKELCKPTK